MKLQINWLLRFKNPVFVASFVMAIISPMLMYMGLNIQDLTTWKGLWDVILSALGNPYCLGMVLVNVYNTVLDPTTKGVNDDEEVMNQNEPWDTK